MISERDRRKISKMQRKMNENLVREIDRERSQEINELSERKEVREVILSKQQRAMNKVGANNCS